MRGIDAGGTGGTGSTGSTGITGESGAYLAAFIFLLWLHIAIASSMPRRFSCPYTDILL